MNSSLRTRLRGSLLLFLLVLPVSVAFVSARNQLTGALAEEHFRLGRDLARFGTSLQVLRPPGYPGFVAGVVTLSPDPSHDELAVQWAQCLLLALSCVAIFWWLARRLQALPSFSAGLLLGWNPLMLVLAGHLHYDVLHVFVTILACSVLTFGIDERLSFGRQSAFAVVAGLVLGVSTLVRPTTLIFPVFVPIVYLLALRFSWRRAAALSVVFTLAMALVIAPLSLRNQKKTGKAFPVGAQGNGALWASTVERAPEHRRLTNSESPWATIWEQEGDPIYKRVAGDAPYLVGLNEKTVELDAAFKRAARENIARRPTVYLRNVVENFRFMLMGAPTGMLDRFHSIQESRPGGHTEHREFWKSVSIIGLLVFMALLSVGAAIGLGLAVYARDVWFLPPACLMACFALAHAITFMDFRYLYIKVPLLLVFYSLFVARAERIRFRFPFTDLRSSLGVAIQLATVLACVVGSLALVLA